MKKDLSNLTICIFSYERKKDLIRILKYLETLNVQVIVMDGSKEALLEQFSKNIRYFNFKNLSLQQRIIKFSELASTEYILLSPDDDFFLETGLKQTLDFLDSNKEYSSAQGLRTRFFDYPAFNWIPDYLSQSKLDFKSENKTERLLQMFHAMHYIYSIIRFSDFVKIANCLRGVNSEKRDSLMVNELVFNYTLPILGKHRVIPVLYSARKAHPYLGGDINFANWINDKNDEESIKFKKNVMDLYTQELACDYDSANLLFDDITKHFSKEKKVLAKRYESKIKRTIKRTFFESKIRMPLYLTKIRYFNFFVLLFKNRNLFLAFEEMHFIRTYLKGTRRS